MSPDTLNLRPLHWLSPQAHADRMDQAKQQALRLRQLAIEAFWADVACWVRRMVRSVQRRATGDSHPVTKQAAPCPR